MAFAPLILRGNLTIDTVDVSAQVTQFKFAGARAQIDIPGTFDTRPSFAGGYDTYEVAIDYLSDTDATALTQIFWTALAADPGTIVVAGTFRTGVVSADNPLWTATAQVLMSSLGGEVNTVGLDSVTFPCLDRPIQTVAP
jgi:hypothetical protein|tara:strand:- start:616 stop:1035 length:420 start_codon:yes stop_codon:yes gene_type:complete